VTLDPDGTGQLCHYASLLLARLAPPRAGDSARQAAAIEAARKAAATSHPYSAYAHVMLWAHHISAGRLSEARQEMRIW